LEDAEEDTEAEDDHEESSETEASSLITEGPSRVVDLILRLTNSSRILELIGKPNYSEDVFVPSIMMLQPYESLPIRPILTSPGLEFFLFFSFESLPIRPIQQQKKDWLNSQEKQS